MKKIGLLIKEEITKAINERLDKADNFFVVDYSGVKATGLNDLRKSLRKTDASFLVSKNSVLRRILKERDCEHKFLSLIKGPIGLIFTEFDIIAVSHIISQFRKVNSNLEIKGGWLISKKRIITAEDLNSLSLVPSLASLYARIAGGLNLPIFGLAFGLRQLLSKLVYVLKEIKMKHRPVKG
ncbi:MAG: 50S ribosomal protein L10 [Candidatus Omnitrophica bacterium]|nr:50S ribosomal protein L10 [Candidatus Omnitrophota bacterium]